MEHNYCNCCDCNVPVEERRFDALLQLYPPTSGVNLPSVPVRCLPCAEKAVKPYIASGGDEDGNNWVPDHVREGLVLPDQVAR
jgi:hypothetical protein